MLIGARDTIFAISSGTLPAAIAVVRVSGPQASDALTILAGTLPPPRRATAAVLRRTDGEMLDRALLLWLPGPGTATGEDIAELHLHGGRAVAAAVLAALGAIEGLRMAEAGEFTRRAFRNGRLDLAQAEGLADLLAAETEAQRRQAVRQSEGGLGRLIETWRDRLLRSAAAVEAAIEFDEDEADVPALGEADIAELRSLAEDLAAALDRPPAERLRDGVRIVLAGPVNAGKSSLINGLSSREAAIVSPLAGTTRDLIEVPVSIGGMPCILIDSAGLRDGGGSIERIGMDRARDAIDGADIILWLGPPDACPDRARSIIVRTKSDLDRGGVVPGRDVDVMTSTVQPGGLAALQQMLAHRVASLLPAADAIALNARHRSLIGEAHADLVQSIVPRDVLLVAEHLRGARDALDRITGRAGVENMLDRLFDRFCIGK